MSTQYNLFSHEYLFVKTKVRIEPIENIIVTRTQRMRT